MHGAALTFSQTDESQFRRSTEGQSCQSFQPIAVEGHLLNVIVICTVGTKSNHWLKETNAHWKL